MVDPSLKSLLGRYEFHDESVNSHKFWTISYDHDSGTYTRNWGRVGALGQSNGGTTGFEALKAIQGKISKGYIKVKMKLDYERHEEEETDFIDIMEELKKI